MGRDHLAAGSSAMRGACRGQIKGSKSLVDECRSEENHCEMVC